jgi:hypothetical protein
MYVSARHNTPFPNAIYSLRTPKYSLGSLAHLCRSRLECFSHARNYREQVGLRVRGYMLHHALTPPHLLSTHL